MIAASGMPLPSVTGDAAVRLSDPLHIVGLGARSTPLVADAGETWRLISCHFVHTSWVHLIFNLAFLFAVGGAIEQVVQRPDYAALILFTGTMSSLGSLLGTPQVSAGASGLVFGTLGAAVTLGLRHHQRLGRRVRRYFGLWVLPFLLIVFGFGIGNPSVDQASHLGGLVSGLVGGSVLSLRSPHHFSLRLGSGWVPLVSTSTFLVVILLAAPLIARAGHPPHTVELAPGTAMDIPGTWLATPDPVHPTFFTAGGVVKLEVLQTPPSFPGDPIAWYEAHHPTPELRAGSAEAPAKRAWIRGRPVVHREYRTWRNATPIQRDVYFVDLEGQAETAIFAFETPWTWRDKYVSTRLRILSSYRRLGSAPPMKMAALQ